MKNIKEKVEAIFIIIILLQLACIIGLTIKLNIIYNRVNDLEKDYKIYEINLNQLQENREVQFDKR